VPRWSTRITLALLAQLGEGRRDAGEGFQRRLAGAAGDEEQRVGRALVLAGTQAIASSICRPLGAARFSGTFRCVHCASTDCVPISGASVQGVNLRRP
jgi:hypothetical protein